MNQKGFQVWVMDHAARGIYSFITWLVILLFLTAGPSAAATVNGIVNIPSPVIGAGAGYDKLYVRVAGTSIVSLLDASGNFSLSGVPTGQIPLILEEISGQWFTQASRHVTVSVSSDPTTGVVFNPAYLWTQLSPPSVMGTADYTDWASHFVDHQIGFILFRVRTDPERMELYKTVNGGTSWTNIQTWTFNSDQWLSGGWWYPDKIDILVYFSDASHGVIKADHYCLPCGECGSGFFYTSDGGSTWYESAGMPTPTKPGQTDPTYDVSIDHVDHISSTHLIAAGTTGCNVQGYYRGYFDVVWESSNGGANWVRMTELERQYGGGTGLGASSSGKAVAFFTADPVPDKMAVRNSGTGIWSAFSDSPYTVSSGITMVGDHAWLYAREVSAIGTEGIYESSDGGSTWTFLSDHDPYDMDFATLKKGFGIWGNQSSASMYVSYDGGETWLSQLSGLGAPKGVWGFDATHAVWATNSALLTYGDPDHASFEVILTGGAQESALGAGTRDNPVAVYMVNNQGSQSLTLDSVVLHATGTGQDAKDIRAVKLWWDKNKNGLPDAGDSVLASGRFNSDNGSAFLNVSSPVIYPRQFELLVVTYSMASTLIGGKTYACSLKPGEVAAKVTGTAASITASGPGGYQATGYTMRAGKRIFFDDFSKGLSYWTADTGTAPWNSWHADASIYTSFPKSAYVWSDRNYTNYGMVNNLTLNQTLDLSSGQHHYLKYKARYHFDAKIFGNVGLSSNGGSSWDTWVVHGSDTGPMTSSGNFMPSTINLDTYNGTFAFKLRFQADWTSTWNFLYQWYIDDVEVWQVIDSEVLESFIDVGAPRNLLLLN